MAQTGAHGIIAEYTSQKKGEEIRAPLSIKIKGSQNQPYFRKLVIPEMIQQIIAENTIGKNTKINLYVEKIILCYLSLPLTLLISNSL